MFFLYMSKVYSFFSASSTVSEGHGRRGCEPGEVVESQDPSQRCSESQVLTISRAHAAHAAWESQVAEVQKAFAGDPVGAFEKKVWIFGP